MHLDKLLCLYLSLAKKQAVALPEHIRTRACQWVKQIESTPSTEDHEKKLRLHALKLLLLSLERNQLVGPFEESPEEKAFTEHDWNSFQLNDFSNEVMTRERNVCGRSNISYAVSGNRRELVTYQDDPSTGEHCYYACSGEPVERWNNLQGGAIPNQTVNTWRDYGEWDILNQTESKTSSIDVVRNQPHTPEIDFVIHDERQNTRDPTIDPRRANLTDRSSCGRPGPSGLQGRSPIERPRTPERFGGVGRAQPYGLEEFGLTRNEEFRSPRGVFENVEYDQYQTRRSPMPGRLTDDVCDSFDNAMALQPPSREKEDSFKRQMCARIQDIRNRMNQPRVEVEQQIEIEPEEVHYERITLQEPCEEFARIDDDFEPGVLSEGEMYDEDMFGEERMLDPRLIFKSKDENLVSHSVVKIETNTVISGNEREVTEEVLEQEDVNVQQRPGPDDNLMDISAPSFQSPPPGFSPIRPEELTQHRPGRWPPRPRRLPTDYSDLPCEDLDDVSQPSFPQASPAARSPRSPARQDVCTRSGQQQVPMAQPAPTCAQRGVSPGPSPRRRTPELRPYPHVDVIERLSDVCQPEFPPSFEDSGHGTMGATRRTPELRPYPHVDVTERLSDVCQPEFPPSFEDSGPRSAGRRRTPELRPYPHVDVTERLSDVCQPEFPPSFEDSGPRSGGRRRTPELRPYPHVDVTERLSDVCQPEFPPSFEDSGPRSAGRRRTPELRPYPHVDVTERLSDVCQPEFPPSFEDSGRTPQNAVCGNLRAPSPCRQKIAVPRDVRRNAPCPSTPCSRRVSTPFRSGQWPPRPRNILNEEYESLPCEAIDDVSQPSLIQFSPSPGPPRPRTPELRPYPHVDVTERLSDVCQPEFPPSFEDSGPRSGGRRRTPELRPYPHVDVTERLSDVCQPEFPPSFEDSGRGTLGTTRRTPELRPYPHVDVTERLSDVCQPEFPPSFEDSGPRSAGRRRTPELRPYPHVDVTERLDDVCQPEFPPSPEDSGPRSAGRRRTPELRPYPHVDVTERLSDVCQPEFPPSFEDSGPRSAGRRRTPELRPYPHVDVTERLSDVCQPEFPPSFEDSGPRSAGRRRTPELRPYPHVDVTERLSDVCQPEFPPSFEDSGPRSGGRRRTPELRPYPHVDVTERLSDVCQPEFPPSFEDSGPRSGGRRRTPELRPYPHVDVTERLSDVCQPEFPPSFEDSGRTPQNAVCGNLRAPSPCRQKIAVPRDVRRNAPCPSTPCSRRVSTPFRSGQWPPRPRNILNEEYESLPCEAIDDVSQPSLIQFSPSPGPPRPRTPELRPYPHVDVTERLSDVCQPEFPPSFEDSGPRSGGRRRTPELRPYPHVDVTERLSDVCQPEFPPSFEDSGPRSAGRRRTPELRPYPHVDVTERLDDVCQPEFPPSPEDSGPRSAGRRRTPELRPYPHVDVTERLSDVCQPEFPPSPEDSGPRSAGRRRTPELRPYPHVDVTERLSDVCQPEFPPSFEDSGPRSAGRRRTPELRPYPHVDVTERLSDVCQPEFPPSFEDSGPRSAGRRRTPELRPYPHVDVTERLDDVCQPEFPPSPEDSGPRSAGRRRTPELRPYPHVDVTERLSDVCQPEFPPSPEDSGPRSAGRRRTPELRPYPHVDVTERLSDVCQPEFPPSFEDSGRGSAGRRRTPELRPYPHVDVTERLDDVCQPEFPPSPEDSGPRSGGRRATPELRPYPHVDVTERLSDVCQPEFPPSFEDSGPRSAGRRRTPELRPYPHVDVTERLSDVCQPEFPPSFGDADSARRSPRGRSLPLENLDDVSQPSFLSTSRSPRQRLEERSSRGPQRTPFPRDQGQPGGRAGDYRQAFESMPYYAPFEQQIAPSRCPIPAKAFATKMRKPGTFGHALRPIPKMAMAAGTSRIPPPGQCPRSRPQSPKPQPPMEQCQIQRPSRLQPPLQRSQMIAGPSGLQRSQIQPGQCGLRPPMQQGQMQSRLRQPTPSYTKIQCPFRREQTGIPLPARPSTSQTAISSEQDRLLKKSTVKFQLTKSTYGKDQHNKSDRTRRSK